MGVSSQIIHRALISLGVLLIASYYFFHRIDIACLGTGLCLVGAELFFLYEEAKVYSKMREIP